MGRCKKEKMIFIQVFIFLMLLILPGIADAEVRIGDSIPPITLTGVTGRSVKIPEHLLGKVVILHFWQVGCSSCRLDMPAMDMLYKKYQKKGLEILAVNVGQKKEVVRSFAAGLQVSYIFLIDPDEKGARLFGVTDVPRTYIIDRRGVVRYRILGSAMPGILKKLILSLLEA